MPNIQDILQADSARLNKTLEIGKVTARIEVQCLLQHVLKVPRAYLLAHPEQVLDGLQKSDYETLLERRLEGEPIAHLLGEREFFGLNFKITPDTLIPRPETELLVELALQMIPLHGHCRVLDLGTGSGAVALSIAYNRPDIEVVAVDTSEAALKVARENAYRLGITHTRFVMGDWFSTLAGQCFDIIVSNPPYVASGDIHLTQGDARFEPISALASGSDGLEDIRHIISQSGAYLGSEAWLFLEHGYDQARAIRSLLNESGFTEVFSTKDIAGIERVSGGMKQE